MPHVDRSAPVSSLFLILLLFPFPRTGSWLFTEWPLEDEKTVFMTIVTNSGLQRSLLTATTINAVIVNLVGLVLIPSTLPLHLLPHISQPHHQPVKHVLLLPSTHLQVIIPQHLTRLLHPSSHLTLRVILQQHLHAAPNQSPLTPDLIDDMLQPQNHHMNKSPALKTSQGPPGKLILPVLSNPRLPRIQPHLPLIGLHLLKISTLSDRKIATRNVKDIEKWRKNVTEKGLVLSSKGIVKDIDLNSIERRKRPTGRGNNPGTDAKKRSSQTLKASCIQTKLPSLAGKPISPPFASLSPVTGGIVRKTESHRYVQLILYGCMMLILHRRLADLMLTLPITKLLLCTRSLQVPSKRL